MLQYLPGSSTHDRLRYEEGKSPQLAKQQIKASISTMELNYLTFSYDGLIEARTVKPWLLGDPESSEHCEAFRIMGGDSSVPKFIRAAPKYFEEVARSWKQSQSSGWTQEMLNEMGRQYALATLFYAYRYCEIAYGIELNRIRKEGSCDTPYGQLISGAMEVVARWHLLTRALVDEVSDDKLKSVLWKVAVKFPAMFNELLQPQLDEDLRMHPPIVKILATSHDWPGLISFPD